METQKPEDNIGDLAAAASASIRQQQDRAQALAASRPAPSRFKPVAAALLVLAFACAAWLQYPNITEPYGRPDHNLDPAAAEAELHLVAAMVEGYRAAQGRYPDNLGQAGLPQTLAGFVAEQKIAYRLTEKGFVLDWSLSRWHAVFDGETGKATVTPVTAAR